MNKGLDALHHPRIKSAKVDISAEGKHGIGYMLFGDTKQYVAIEEELKEHERYKAIKELCEKVVEKPIYEKYIDTHEIHEEDYIDCSVLYSFKHNRIEFYMYDFVYYLELDQYGKTWALTREELE